MYRFLLTRRWLGLIALVLAMVAVMIGLGRWQLTRYQERAAINARIDAAAGTTPAPLPAVLPPAAPGGGAPVPADAAWSWVTVTGVYDTAGEILARGRTVDGRVGFEVITPLRLADGSAVLVDRGWVPPAHGDITTRPQVPPPPGGQVSVVGRIHLSESGGHSVERVAGGGPQVRRISVPDIARELSYPVYGAYLLAEPVEPGFTAIPVRHESAWQNAAYVFQWWLLAALTVVAFGYLARREAVTGRQAPTRPDVRAGSEPPVDSEAPAGGARSAPAAAGASTVDG